MNAQFWKNEDLECLMNTHLYKVCHMNGDSLDTSATKGCLKKQIQLFSCAFIFFYCWLALLSTPTCWAESSAIPEKSNALSLNIRLSRKAIRPPESMLASTVRIPNVQIAKPMVGLPAQSAILEDDRRHRIMVLTTENHQELTAYMLEDIDLLPHLPELRKRLTDRQCASDRMEVTGGLGCIALCVKEILETEVFR